MNENIHPNQLYFFKETENFNFPVQFQDNFVLTVAEESSDNMIGLLPIRKAIRNPETVFYKSFKPIPISIRELTNLITKKEIELVKTFDRTTYTPNSSNRLFAHVIFRTLIGRKKIHTKTFNKIELTEEERVGKKHYYIGIGKYTRTSCGVKISDDEFRQKWEYVPNTTNQIRIRKSTGDLCKKCQLDEE